MIIYIVHLLFCFRIVLHTYLLYINNIIFILIVKGFILIVEGFLLLNFAYYNISFKFYKEYLEPLHINSFRASFFNLKPITVEGKGRSLSSNCSCRRFSLNTGPLLSHESNITSLIKSMEMVWYTGFFTDSYFPIIYKQY